MHQFKRWSLAGSPDDLSTSKTSMHSRSATPHYVLTLNAAWQLVRPSHQGQHSQAMAGASQGEWSDDDAEVPKAYTHNEEQEELKRSFLQASNPAIQFATCRVVCHLMAWLFNMQAAEVGKGEAEDEMSNGAVGGFLHTRSQAGGVLLVRLDHGSDALSMVGAR